MQRHRIVIPLALAAVMAGSAHAAGVVEVAFVEPERFTDIGRSAADRGRVQATLDSHMQRWASRLADGQTLRIEVLDVDLAGEVRHTGSARELRVLTGRADVPRMTLRYTLKEGDRVLRQGESRLVELGYLEQPQPRGSSALPHETRLLDDWFDQTLAAFQAQ